MIRIIFVLITLGATFTYLGYREYQLSQRCGSEPQTITVRDLAAMGPGENCYVNVTEFSPLGTLEWTTPKRRRPNKTEFFTPLIPAGDAERIAGENLTFNLVVRTENGDTLGQLDRANHLSGLIVNEVETLNSKTLDAIAEQYPDSDPNTYLILDLNRKPASGIVNLSYLGGGALFFLIGLSLGGFNMRKSF